MPAPGRKRSSLPTSIVRKQSSSTSRFPIFRVTSWLAGFATNLGLNSARVVAVSGNSLDRETLIQNGIDAALLKPVGIQELITVLKGAPRPKTLILKTSLGFQTEASDAAT